MVKNDKKTMNEQRSEEKVEKQKRQFERAVEWANAQRNIKKEGQSIDDYKDILLEMYGWYKQATEPDQVPSLPPGIGIETLMKWQSWQSKKGIDPTEAMRQYVIAINSLKRRLSTTA